jgi:hypothetical protein
MAAVIWAGVFVAVLVMAHGSLDSEVRPGYYATMMWFEVMRVVFWALCTPLVWMMGRRFPIVDRKSYSALAVHSLMCLVFMQAGMVLRLPFAIEALDLGWNGAALQYVYARFGVNNLIDAVVYWGILAAGWLIEQIRLSHARELRESQLQAQLAAAELLALKQQLQPHFLFNCLNAISALMRDGDNRGAIDALAKLSGLMRALMQTVGVHEVELAREIDYVQRYLDLEKLRFDERLQTRFDFDEESLGAVVPTLLLQPLVENAVKHGIARRRSPGLITIRARVSDARLRVEVENDPPEGLRGYLRPDGQRLGLATTRARLSRVYGTDYTLTTQLDGPGLNTVSIQLPFKPKKPNPRAHEPHQSLDR